MRVPLSWLREYVDLPSGSTPESVMAELVRVGLEEEAAHRFEVTGPVVVGQVLEFQDEPQSNGKTIRWCQVRVSAEGVPAADGGHSIRGIVCGANNFEVDDKVVVCLPGSVLPGPFPIAARQTYGHTSDGMLASARELGLSEDHSGILRLSTMGLDPKVGVDAIELLGLDDAAAEVNVTPDRGYALSVRGVAREFALATGAEFRDPIGNAHPEPGHGFSIVVDDKAPIRGRSGCSRFVIRSVVNLKPDRPTPPWMAARLKLAGMRSISLIVDITNYVMLELGQPLHAYDADKIRGGITVRRAKKGESLKTLDGQLRVLHPEDLLICDDSGPIGLAGVIGGESTEVSETTTRVLVEAANFDPISIARSARRHKLPSEASKRFERGVDPAVADFAAARVVQLLEVQAWGAADSLGGEVHEHAEPKPIWLPAGYAHSRTGIEFDAAETSEILQQIGCLVAHVDGGYEVVPASWRPDLTEPADLAEELARVAGYERIPTRLPIAPPGRGLSKEQKIRRRVANLLAHSGHTEVLNYPFLGAAANRLFENDGAAESVQLANALQEDASELRRSLLPELLRAAHRNYSRGLIDLALFEIGQVFLPTAKVAANKVLPVGAERPSDKVMAQLAAVIPEQPRHVAGVMTGRRYPHGVASSSQAMDYRDALQAASLAAQAAGLKLEVRQAQLAGFHPGRGAEFFVKLDSGELLVGAAGEVHPDITADYDLPRRVAAFWLDLSRLVQLSPESPQASPIETYPAATQDVSLVVDLAVPASDLQSLLSESCSPLLEWIALVDDYRGENIASGKKSLSFAMRFRAADRTLTQAEVTQVRDDAVAKAAERFGAYLRA